MSSGVVRMLGSSHHVLDDAHMIETVREVFGGLPQAILSCTTLRLLAALARVPENGLALGREGPHV